MTRPIRAISSSPSLSRRLVMLFALLAFALQAYLVQTHIHGQQPGVLSLKPHVSAPVQPAPFDPLAPANCALCQEILHAGTAITPDNSQLALLLTWIGMAPAVALLPAEPIALTTGWHSRAPPVR
jgi:hypothetical protein